VTAAPPSERARLPRVPLASGRVQVHPPGPVELADEIRQRIEEELELLPDGAEPGIEDEDTQETPVAAPARAAPRTNEIDPHPVEPDPLADLPVAERIDKRLARMVELLEKWDKQESRRQRDPLMERALDEGQAQLRERGKAACQRSARAMGGLALDYATANPGNAVKAFVSVPVLAWVVAKVPVLVEIIWDWWTAATGLVELWR
jgi:hypothetical protein